MDSQARVHSSTSIESVRTALMSFVDQVGDALTELEAEMRRMQDWLEHDRPRHWKSQVRLANDQVHEAQQALQRCLMFPVANERPSCAEERAALKKAQARHAYCERKAERVRHWQKVIKHELFEYQGRISQLVRLVEIDAPQAIGMLGKVLRHLEEYQAVQAADPQASYNAQSFARELWPEEGASAKEQGASSEERGAGGEEREGSREDVAAAEEVDGKQQVDAARKRKTDQGED